MRILLFFSFLFFLLPDQSYAQTNPSDKELMDSLLKNDELLKLINSYDKTSSYFRVNIGFGNNLYSNQNKAVETLQNNQEFVISPSAEYNNKSGLGVSFTGFLFNENSKTNFYQYTLTPFYNYTKNKNVSLSIYYTHYFEKDKFSLHSSPVQDQIYGSILFKKDWLKPGIAAGYSSGQSREIIKIDTTITLPNRQLHIKYIDTTTTHISSYSLTGSLEHSFEFYNLLSPKDGLIFTPQFSVITGTNSYTTRHTSSLANYNAYTKKRLRRIRNLQSQANNNKYLLQSLGLDLDINYGIGKIYFEPELYLDYYIPDTSNKKFTQIFNFNIGITF